MKKNLIALGLITLIFVMLMTGCATVNTNETKCQATVLQCEKGNFVKNNAYIILAEKALFEKDFSKVALYNTMAKNTGWYEYKVTFDVEGEVVILTLQEEYQIGDVITITRKETFLNGELTEISYYK